MKTQHTSEWETLKIDFAADLKIFKANWIRRRHPEWKKEGNFIVLDSPLWVNIIPVTKDNNVIFVEQYRHGSDSLTLEVPGGLVELGEDPKHAAERECCEETGFRSKSESVLLGENLPNPAFLNNKCYSYIWFDCEKVSNQNLDGYEDIRVLEVPINEIRNYILDGRINHSLVLTAFLFYFLKY